MRKIVVSISAGALFLCGSAIGVTGAGASSDSNATGAGASGDNAQAAQLRGRRGPRGRRGRRGRRGPRGFTGAAGPAGATGATGATGPQGPQGFQGIQGPPGDDGSGGADGNLLIDFRSDVSGVSLAATPFVTIYDDPNGGFLLQAKCANTLATPQMDARVLGQEDDGILEANSIDSTVITQVTPGADGDIDNGDGIAIGAVLTGNEVNGLWGTYADNGGEATALQAVLRTKTSTGSTPTQGSCAFVGVASAAG